MRVVISKTFWKAYFLKVNKRQFLLFWCSLPSLFVMPLFVLSVIFTQLHRNAWVALIFMLFIFQISLSYMRLNDTGDISNYLTQYKYSCQNQSFSVYQMIYPIWYATFKLYCPFEQGFRIWSSTMVSFGYLFLILNIRILIDQINFSKEGKIIRFLVIVAILAAYSLPFLMTSFRTFISFNVLGFLILTELYKLKLNFYIRVALVTIVLGFHPFPAFFLIIFYLIFKRSLVFFVLVIPILTVIPLFYPSLMDVLQNKISVYVL